MAKYRVHKTKDYTIMSNIHLKEKEMSLKAKGLLSVMLSLSDNWNYSIDGLVSICKENETAIKSTLDELKTFGYLTVTKLMPNETKSGRIQYVYDIYEIPKQEGEKQGIENLPLEFLPIENQGQLNTNILNTNILNTNTFNNTSSKKKLQRKVEDYEAEFEEIWSLYPRKEAKAVGLKHYISARKHGTTFEEVKDGVERYSAHCKIKGTAKEYIKKGGNYFKEKLWTEEYDMTPKTQTPTKIYGANGIAIAPESEIKEADRKMWEEIERVEREIHNGKTY